MAEVLVIGKKISEMGLVNEITGEEKIPTSALGDKAVTTGQLLTYVNNNGVAQWGRIGGDITNQVDLQNQFTQERDTLKGYTQEHIDATNEVFEYARENGSALPYKEGVSYEENAVVVKDGELQQWKGGVWRSAVAESLSDTVQTFNTPEAGVDPVTGVVDGVYFNVRSTEGDSFLVEYRNVGGVPTPSGKSYPSAAYVQSVARYTALPFVAGKTYSLSERVQLAKGDIVKNTIDGNTTDPNVAMTGWEYVNKFSHQKPLINQKNVNQFCKVWSLERTAATGGIYSVPQGVAYDPVNQRLFQVADGGADGRGHSLNIYEAKTTGTLSGDMYVRNLSRYFGHQGIGVSYHGDDTVAWMSSNYRGDNAPIADSGNKVTAFSNFRDTTTADITDVYVFKLFDNGDIDQSCTPAVSSCGRYLVAKYASSYHPMCAVRVFDVQAMWANRDTKLDYSNDYLYQFDYQWLSGTHLQGLACDGNFVYLQFGTPQEFTDNNWITIFTLNGEFVDKVNFSVVGHQDALDDKHAGKVGKKEYEGLLIIDDTLFCVMATKPNIAEQSEISCYVYAMGVSSFTLKDKDSNVVTANYMHSASPRNTDYRFGVKNKNNDLYWRVSSIGSRKGALLNRDNPYLTIDGLPTGLQLASNDSEGMSNMLCARTDDTDVGARIMFYKSRSGDLKETRKSMGSSTIATIPFYGDTGVTDVMAANITVRGEVSAEGYIAGRIILATRDGLDAAHNFTFSEGGMQSNRNNTHDIGTSVNAFKKAWLRGLSVKDLPVFADNAAATSGGLVNGDVYRTPLSDVKVVSPTVLKWLAMGDSITDTTTSHPSYAAKVASILTTQLIDCAISGTRIRSAFARNTASNANITAANVISIFHGTNDYSRNTPLGTINDTPTPRATLNNATYRQDSNTTGSFYADYKGVIESIYATNPQAKIVLITPLFRYREVNGAANSAGITLKQYVDAVKSVANYYNLAIVDLYSDSGINRVTGATWLSDGLHPTQWTQDNVIAPLISSKLKTML